MKPRNLSLLLIFLLVFIGLFTLVFARESIVVATPNPAEPGVANFTNLGTFWQLTAKAGGLRWAIFAVFALGIFLVAWKLLELYSQWRQANKLMGLNFRQLRLEEITETVNGQPQNILSRLIVGLLNIFHSTGSVAGLNEEISNYVKYEQDKFDTFKTRLLFLSDTAGALGLLGTVWGMFLTFFTGNLDKQVILNGMGIALLTTLLGLVVSIILNLSTTEVYSLFQKLLDKVAMKSEELRFRLLELSASPGIAVAGMRSTTPAGPATMPPSRPRPQAPRAPESKRPVEHPDEESLRQQKALEEMRRKTPARILWKTPPPETITATDLPVMCQGQVVNASDEGLADISLEILCQGTGSAGEPGRNRFTLTTETTGHFSLPIYPGEKPGRLKYLIRTETDTPTVELSFTVQVQAGPPAQLKIRGGNHQSAPIGKKLPRPLAVQIFDAFANPVREAVVLFRASAESGIFQNGKPEIEVKTNELGVATTEFKLGKTPGLIVIACQVPGTDLAEEFELFGQETEN